MILHLPNTTQDKLEKKQQKKWKKITFRATFCPQNTVGHHSLVLLLAWICKEILHKMLSKTESWTLLLRRPPEAGSVMAYWGAWMWHKNSLIRAKDESSPSRSALEWLRRLYHEWTDAVTTCTDHKTIALPHVAVASCRPSLSAQSLCSIKAIILEFTITASRCFDIFPRCVH